MRDPTTSGAATANGAHFCMVNHGVFELGISSSALALYVAFLRFADNETGDTFPSRKTLGKLLGMSVPTVDKYIAELEEAGLLSVFARWRNSDGDVSSQRSEEYDIQTSNGYVVEGYEGVSNILARRGKESLPGGAKDLYTNYTHSKLYPSLTRGSSPEKSSRGTRISEDWMPRPETVEKIKASVPGLDIATEHEKFVDYFLSVSGEKGVKKDWDAAWRNWMRRAKQWSADSPSSGGGKSDYFKNMAAAKAQQLAVSGQAELEGF